MAFITLVLHTFSERLIAWFKSLFHASDDLLEVQCQQTDSKSTKTRIYTIYRETKKGLAPLNVSFRKRKNAEDFMRSQIGVLTLVETELVDLEIYDETNSEGDETSSEEDEIPRPERLTLTQIMAKPVPEMTPEQEKEFKILEDLFGS